MRLLQFGAWLDPELVGEPAAQVGEQPQRGRLLPAAGEGEHGAGVQALVQRLLMAEGRSEATASSDCPRPMARSAWASAATRRRWASATAAGCCRIRRSRSARTGPRHTASACPNSATAVPGSPAA